GPGRRPTRRRPWPKTGGTPNPGARRWTERCTNPLSMEARMRPATDRLPNRDLRQRELVPPERLAACHAAVIGIGAIGRQVALQLAAVGIPLLLLYDDDAVAEENLAPQGYRPDQLGLAKVDATAADCRRIHPGGHMLPEAERFRRSTPRQLTVGESSLVILACVASI